jgi:4-amino-4-deoxy-L-arabinose transferase-like glycosyltransferase
MNTKSATSGMVTISRNSPSPAVCSGILGVVTFLLLCLGNHSLPLIDRDEPRFAEASREMRERSDWIVPRFNNLPRYDKPPLIYWMQAASYRVLGDHPFAARMPSALCTAICAALVCLWASSLQPDPESARRTGLRAGCMFVLCLQVFIHGRAAVADPPMVLLFVACSWAGWNWANNPSPWRCLFFWTLLAFGFLAKGPVAWVPVAMVALALRDVQRDKGTAPSLAQWCGGCVWMLLLTGVWGIPALIQTRGEFASIGLGKHVVARSVGSLEGHGARSLTGYLLGLPYYFVSIFISFAPWAFWLPAALRDLRGKTTREQRFLLSGAGILFLFFTLSRTKLPHYTLPAFPLLAIVLALWWETHRPRRAWTITALCMLGIFALAPFSFRAISSLFVTENLIQALLPHLSPGTRVALVDFEEPSLIWGLRSHSREFPTKISKAQIETWLREHPQDLCIMTEDAARHVPHLKAVARADGWNFAKGKHLQLVALTWASTEPSSSNGN